jgi:hypothetical protein
MQAGWPGTTRPPLTVGTGVADAAGVLAPADGAPSAVPLDPVLLETVPLDAVAHPAARAVASSGTANATARRPAGQDRRARSAGEISVLM